MYDMFDNEFELHMDLDKGYELDPNASPKNCHMIENQTGVVVKITANTFFGCKLEVVEDPNNILGDDHKVGNCPPLYDSLSPLNKNKDVDC
jgi:hypothetical protein